MNLWDILQMSRSGSFGFFMPLLSNTEFNISMHLILFDWLSHAAFQWERCLTQAVILFLFNFFPLFPQRTELPSPC